jgi:hypothetical protein
MAGNARVVPAREGGRRRRLRRALAASLVAAAALATRAETADDPRVSEILARSALDARTRAGLRTALRIAIRKLEGSACREILSAFPGAWEAPPPSPDGGTAGLLAGIKFKDGVPYQVCRDSRVLAFTHPGAREVFLCGEHFSRAAFSTPDYAANILIHEALHTLGLRENPPAPGEITARIASSCHVDDAAETVRSNALNVPTEIRIGGAPR